MGTWGTGPFDSDVAADFVDGLGGRTPQQIIDLMASAFQRVLAPGMRVDGGDGAEAVAAAALIASRVPDSPVVFDPGDGPSEPIPDLPPSLRPMAQQALHRVLQDGSELAAGWVEGTDADEWRRAVQLIAQTLGVPH
ncbi:DUF4259 domain-containing protein [Streptomyces sp. DSM 40750]|uniref:DUF4259 domain-containing protein n=1 Tax=Streptomyces sp. DSM 40750 TaxID=2801030 RepID=UPI00214C8A9C|nr:DUF4259 domain-containing protein [Streptomyces sp. DSM 40750]UUU19317.1 DUF4259 domain-containing protein [Streptomyces sp. DSM 40750]UUU27340.1 DUF4259 domain-containing protein [Streptomyces sp. DSM 40750]